MHTQTLEESPRNPRGGQISYLLLTKGQFGSSNLSITWPSTVINAILAVGRGLKIEAPTEES